ncbi:hypothetical protein C7B82_20735 [Stenomitos frigidus ULC18]|uniref:Uncharacterized protein n=2 Tax=Stenomitos TaxID=1844270 RepID=A0A2T1E046_9CYAN|nr:hypothetical protein C7B82_20735 [Stenomitos frigidus ULC18]
MQGEGARYQLRFKIVSHCHLFVLSGGKRQRLDDPTSGSIGVSFAASERASLHRGANPVVIGNTETLWASGVDAPSPDGS